MTARTENVLLKSLLQQETETCRRASPQPQRNTVEISNQQDDSWRVVAADGSTSIITCKSADDIHASSKTVVGDDSSNADAKAEMFDDLLSDMRDPGVDLSVLNTENETTSKVIAGMKAMILDKPGTVPQRDLKMPIAGTDLHKIFETDQVCMVNLKQ
jgi:hypothetical protein